MGTSDHHLDRAQRYLHFALEDFHDEQYLRAVDALRRSVTHAASSILAKQGRPVRTRRRLHNVLSELVFEGRLPHAHLTTFRRVHDLPHRMETATPAETRHMVRVMRPRVKRLVRDVSNVMYDGGPWEAYEETGIPRLLSRLPQLEEMHTTVPARCNNLSVPAIGAPGMRLAYDPQVCPKCANLPARLIPRAP
ncbi:MAG: hypothetical protein OXE87_00360 [Chloroflexi bacterium]|nr:hypothetical protein [Chloroflexota bacterium]